MTKHTQSGSDRSREIIAGVGSRVDDVWWYFMLRGLLAAALGVCALIWPTISLNILLRLVGLYLVADGIAGLVTAQRYSERSPQLLQAGIGLIVGGVLLFWPGATARMLLVIFGIWAAFSGVSQFFAARGLPAEDPDRGLLITIGAIATALGLVLIFWPGTGVVTISWVIAAAALAIAALFIFMALRLKRLTGRVEQIKNRR